MGRDHRKLIIYQLAKELALIVYRETKNFPREEMFGLTSQMRRAAVSITANIVEGSVKDSKKDFLRFLSIARGSAAELEYYIELSKNLTYIDEKSYGLMVLYHKKAAGALFQFVKVLKED